MNILSKVPIEQVPYFAVLLAACNGEKYLSQQISTILEQVDVRLKIFISLDSSSDNSEELLRDLAIKDPRVILLKQGGHYGCAALNFYRLISEVDFSEFDYIALSDQDDIWKLNKLKVASNKLKENSLLCYSSNVLAQWANKKKIVKKSTKQVQWDYYFESPGPGCTFVLTTSIAEKLKKLLISKQYLAKKIIHHDLLIYAFARSIGEKWLIDDWVSMSYRQHENNEVGANVGLRAFYRRLILVLNGYAIRQSLLISKFIYSNKCDPISSGFNSGRLGFLRLAFHAKDLRRSRLHQLYIFIYFILLFICNPKINKKPVNE